MSVAYITCIRHKSAYFSIIAKYKESPKKKCEKQTCHSGKEILSFANFNK